MAGEVLSRTSNPPNIGTTSFKAIRASQGEIRGVEREGPDSEPAELATQVCRSSYEGKRVAGETRL